MYLSLSCSVDYDGQEAAGGGHVADPRSLCAALAARHYSGQTANYCEGITDTIAVDLVMSHTVDDQYPNTQRGADTHLKSRY